MLTPTIAMSNKNGAVGGIDDVVIDIRNVSKRFKLYHNPVLGPLKELLHFWQPDRLYREYLAINDVSFSVKRGEIVGIIGPNGAGKTTLLKMIAGLLPVREGSISVKGKITALLALGVGVHPEFSGRENIFFNGLLLGMPAEEIRAKTESIVEFSEIGRFIDQPFRTYSSGMKARLLFSISMSVDPDIMIVDEALATGDIAFVRKCERRIRELCDSGATILFVSHNMTQINSLCDRSLLLMKGQLVCDGSPLEVFDKYRELYVQSEAERLAEKARNEKYVSTGGDGGVVLEDVILTDKDGTPGNAFYTGEPMNVVLKLKWRKPAPKCHLFVGILMGSQYVGYVDSENLVTTDGHAAVEIHESETVTVRIDQVVMLNGVFSLWILLQSAETREVIGEYRGVGNFRIAKGHYPFDADSYFVQPVRAIEAESGVTVKALKSPGQDSLAE
jgi:ABC-type polysaccharide/polyol phosphate transport system ATPase subunit